MPVRAFLLGIPLPSFLCPAADGQLRVAEGRYQFDVTVRSPLAGDVISYRGWLEPVG